MSYRVVIPTAGLGSRLGGLTKFLNKSLVSIAHRPTICHLIEQFPEDSEFVIALGYKGNLVRDFLELAYPNRIFYYADVDPFEGEGSGLGFSLLCCEEYLQQPFIFLSCDTLVTQKIPPPDHNWMGFADLDDLSSYRTVAVQQGRVQGIHEKGDAGADELKAYIGLAGIKDYASFWAMMREGGHAAIEQGEAYGLRGILTEQPLTAYEFEWFDTGSPAGLAATREAYRTVDEPNILEKENEAIWFVNGQVIKFSDDIRFVANRVERAKKLVGFVPNVRAVRPHMYSYNKVPGRVLSEAVTLPLFREFLAHCKRFWKSADLNLSQQSEFNEICKKFYFNKTKERVELFYKNFSKEDGAELINGEEMPTLDSLFERIDWDSLTQGLPGQFHGDFHFENIIWNAGAEKFTFLDWRQDFGGDLDVGDIYYDLAKLLHGLIVSHELIANEAYTVSWESNQIHFDLHRKQVLVECEQYFSLWCNENGFSYHKVRLLTALIYLNIAALHHYPYSLLLYALGKRMLRAEIESSSNE